MRLRHMLHRRRGDNGQAECSGSHMAHEVRIQQYYKRSLQGSGDFVIFDKPKTEHGGIVVFSGRSFDTHVINWHNKYWATYRKMKQQGPTDRYEV